MLCKAERTKSGDDGFLVLGCTEEDLGLLVRLKEEYLFRETVLEEAPQMLGVT